MATTTLAGNSGNNTLNASGLESTLVQGFAGNDTITLARVDDDAQGGDGNDTIGLTKTGTHSNDVTGGAGNDSITFLSASVFEVTVGGGAGNDLITLGGGADASTVTDVQIRANEGNDTIVFNTAAALRTINQSYVGLGQGNDSIIFGATNVLGASDVFGGKGKDTIVLSSVDGADSTINGGNGADLLNLNSATLTNAKIGAGKGSDSIAFGTANNALTGSVAGGGLNDTISITALTNGSALTIFGDANGVTTVGTGTDGGADGADVIGNTASLIDRATIYGGGGKDTIKFLSQAVNGLVVGGNGADSISLIGTGTYGSVNGGAGDDNLFKAAVQDGALTNNATLNGGAGNDTITYAGGTTALAATGAAALYHMVVAGVESGDKIKLSSTALSVATTVNWIGASGQIRVITALNGSALGVTGTFGESATIEGSVAVFVTGGDTYFLASICFCRLHQVCRQGQGSGHDHRSWQREQHDHQLRLHCCTKQASNDTGLVFTIIDHTLV